MLAIFFFLVHVGREFLSKFYSYLTALRVIFLIFLCFLILVYRVSETVSETERRCKL